MRACIVTCDHKTALLLMVSRLRLPEGVRFAKMRDSFERANVTEVRLEGEGLPARFEVKTGLPLKRGELVVDLEHETATVLDREVPDG